ncbi:hypothetical protein CHU98_g11162 [Xylaria longipes]|nr:hypothetical protein CHU98_g11162 [Xylaria longipes]
MHSPNIDKSEGSSTSASSHHRPRNDDRQDEEESNRVKSDNKPSRFHSLKSLFRSMSLHHPSGSSTASLDHCGDQPVRRPNSSPDESRSNHRHDKPENGPKPKLNELPSQKASPGTRGLFVPAYSSPEHFSQRRNNPALPILSVKQRSQDEVIVGFYDCENITLGRKLLTSPNIKGVVSAAVAFIGECQLRDTPDAFIPRHPNPAYRGLSLEGSHGGYHLHFPDYAGAQAFHGDISADWDRLMHIHARDFSGSVLLIGVGLGEPGTQCR